jgi:hypothetical protein
MGGSRRTSLHERTQFQRRVEPGKLFERSEGIGGLPESGFTSTNPSDQVFPTA